MVRRLLDAGELARLEQAVERNLAEPSGRAIEGGGDAGAGRFFEDFRNWTRIPGYEEVIRGSRIGAVAARLMGSRAVRLHHDHLLVKEPGTTIRTPWHQDQPYYNIDGSPDGLVLDPARRRAAREHARVRGGLACDADLVHAAQLLRRRALVFEEGTFDEVPDVESDRDAHAILGWALAPGDAVAFNMLTLHAAAGSRKCRRAFSVRLVGDDARLAARPHPTSPPFPSSRACSATATRSTIRCSRGCGRGPLPPSSARRSASATPRPRQHDLYVAVDPGVGERDLLARACALEQQVDARARDPQAGQLDAVEPARERRAADAQPAAQAVGDEPEAARDEVRDRARRPGLRLARDRVRHRVSNSVREKPANSSGSRYPSAFEAASSSASKIRAKSSSKPYLRSPNAIIAVSCGQTVPRW